jgi:GFO/IDH/MocA oxidoreductase family protein
VSTHGERVAERPPGARQPSRPPTDGCAQSAGAVTGFDPILRIRAVLYRESECRSHMSDPVRLALVGCGRIAQVAHLPAVGKAEGVELVAVSDPVGEVARSVARRYGLSAAYTNQGSVWADASVEAVIITAPDRFHHGLTADALGAGRHVLVEKPLASTVQEAEDLVGLVDRTGLTLQVGAMRRHDRGCSTLVASSPSASARRDHSTPGIASATCARASRRPCSHRSSAGA